MKFSTQQLYALPIFRHTLPPIYATQMFTQFEYLPSEYDRVKLMGKFDRLKHKLSQTTPSEFVVRAPPAPPRGAPAFSEFAYVTDPAEAYDSSVLADNDVGRSRWVGGRICKGASGFVGGGLVGGWGWGSSFQSKRNGVGGVGAGRGRVLGQAWGCGRGSAVWKDAVVLWTSHHLTPHLTPHLAPHRTTPNPRYTTRTRHRVVAGPFYPAGRPKSATSLKGRLDECMMGLCRQLSEDWPTGFLQVTAGGAVLLGRWGSGGPGTGRGGALAGIWVATCGCGGLVLSWLRGWELAAAHTLPFH